MAARGADEGSASLVRLGKIAVALAFGVDRARADEGVKLLVEEQPAGGGERCAGSRHAAAFRVIHVWLFARKARAAR